MSEEKRVLRVQFANRLIIELKKRGFDARLYGKASGGKILVGKVLEFDHGSAALRGFIKQGFGASSMLVTFKVLSEKNAPLADFDVLASSGGKGGVFNMGSFMEDHIADASVQTAKYLDKKASD